MPKSCFLSLCALSAALTLAACSGGQGNNDTLVDGAVDRPDSGGSSGDASDAGPPMMPSDAAGPATGQGRAAQAAGGSTAAAPATAGAMLTLATGGAHGPHLADSAGNALYQLEGDRDGSKCVGECLTAWPPVLATGPQPQGAAGLQGAMISTIARPDGSRQVMYNRRPLYRYAADTGAGSTAGHGVKDQHGTWQLVSAAGAPVAAGHAGH